MNAKNGTATDVVIKEQQSFANAVHYYCTKCSVSMFICGN